MTGQATFVRSETALFRSVWSEVLLVRPDREEIDLLSGPGAITWDLLTSPRTAGEIASVLADLYYSPLRGVEEDIGRLLADLEERGWVTRVDNEG